jgi:protein mraZ
MDAKGRIFMPAKMRDDLSEVFYIVRGVDKCITIYTDSEWQKIADKCETNGSVKTRRSSRSMFSSTENASLDSQGRVTISQKFQEYAGLSKEVVVIGNNTCIEIWNKEDWLAEVAAFDNEQYEKGLEELGV